MMIADRRHEQTALAGIRVVGLTLTSREPGIAPSRLNANVIREALVRHAVVQNSWPAVEISSTRKCQPWGEGLAEDQRRRAPPPAETLAGSCTAKTKASSRT